MHCQHMILGICWHGFVRNTEVITTTNLPCVQDIITKRWNSLFGHVVRPDDHTPAHRALSQVAAVRTGSCLNSDWRRRPGRPRYSWIQQIGDGTPFGICAEWSKASRRGHSRLTQQTSAVYVIRWWWWWWWWWWFASSQVELSLWSSCSHQFTGRLCVTRYEMVLYCQNCYVQWFSLITCLSQCKGYGIFTFTVCPILCTSRTLFSTSQQPEGELLTCCNFRALRHTCCQSCRHTHCAPSS